MVILMQHQQRTPGSSGGSENPLFTKALKGANLAKFSPTSIHSEHFDVNRMTKKPNPLFVNKSTNTKQNRPVAISLPALVSSADGNVHMQKFVVILFVGK